MDFRVIGFEWLLKTPYERDPHHSSNRILSRRQKSNQINWWCAKLHKFCLGCCRRVSSWDFLSVHQFSYCSTQLVMWLDLLMRYTGIRLNLEWNCFLVLSEFTGRPAGPMIVLNMEYGKDFSGAGWVQSSTNYWFVFLRKHCVSMAVFLSLARSWFHFLCLLFQ